MGDFNIEWFIYYLLGVLVTATSTIVLISLIR